MQVQLGGFFLYIEKVIIFVLYLAVS